MKINNPYSLHCHTGKSNASLGFPDSSIKIEDLVKKSKDKGLSGIAVTDHELIGSFIEAKNLEEKYDIDVICGNEIYLVSDGQYEALKNNYDKETMYYPHFILLARDKIGAFQLIKLSTIAWTENAYVANGLYRRPTKMSDIEEVIGDDKGHIIATSACLGGSIPQLIISIRDNPDREEIAMRGIEAIIEWSKEWFYEFYLEIQPATEFQQDQLYVNDKIKEISKKYNVPYVIATDAHYLDKNLLSVHENFLHSKEDDEREVIDFYRTAYLMSSEEIYEYFLPYWTEDEISIGLKNTIKIGQSCERYDFKKKQEVPEVEFDDGWEEILDLNFFPKDKEYIQKTLKSPYYQDRYLMYKIQLGILKFDTPEDYESVFNRIEQELAECWHVSEILEDRIHNYYITMEKVLEIVWDRNGGDSIVGVGRGSISSSKIAHLLEIIQLDPIKMPVDMPFYRFMDRARPEMMDIDFDTESAKRLRIFNAVKRYFEKLGGDAVNCCTYGKYGSKSAIKVAGKGLGLSNDECSVMASLIPFERGFSWSIDDCYYGNESEGRKPVKQFVDLVDKHEGLLETTKLIEGVYVNRGVHASGVFLTNKPFTDFSAKMVSPKGIITSQWDLHESEEAGLLKYDFLTTTQCDTQRLTMEMLIENGYLEKQDTLKETFQKYFSPSVLDYNHEKAWRNIHENRVPNLFQFNTLVAMDAVRKIKPTSLVELMQTNSLMRLQARGEDAESPVETYARFKSDPEAWGNEMREWGIPFNEQKILREVLDSYYGVADTQEAMMAITRHPKIAGFDVTSAHFARKTVAKKDKKLHGKLKKMLFEACKKNGLSDAMANYIWEVQIGRQLLYSFSILHTIAYTFIGLIGLVMYTNYPSVYWNCACLITDSEAIDEEELIDGEEDDDIWASNSSLDEMSEKEIEENKSQSKGTNYGKVASAIAKMQKQGVDIRLPDINETKLTFTPNEKTNSITFGLKGIVGINEDIIHDIINNRPYSSIEDFHKRMVLKKKKVLDSSGKEKNMSLVPTGKMITLIKSGAFDNISEKNRVETMKDYIETIHPRRNKLTFQNINKVFDMNILPESLALETRIYKFYKFVTNKKNIIENDPNTKSKKWFNINYNDSINAMTETFFEEHFMYDLKENSDYRYEQDGTLSIFGGADSCDFDKICKEKYSNLSDWLSSEECVNSYNDNMSNTFWVKYTGGTDNISKWEMDSVVFYYHEHELSHVDREKYDIANYFDLPEEPEPIGYNEWRGIKYPKYEIVRICGTVLDRDKTKHIVSLLTPDGVVPVKYESGQFTHYDKQVSYLDNDGKKVTIEDGWFKRGNKLILCGYRINGRFKTKKYRDTLWQHTTMLIEDIDDDGNLSIKSERSRV